MVCIHIYVCICVFCYRQTAVLHWLVNGRVLDPGKSGDSESRVTANQRIAGYLFQVLIILSSRVFHKIIFSTKN